MPLDDAVQRIVDGDDLHAIDYIAETLTIEYVVNLGLMISGAISYKLSSSYNGCC
jgi:hypothetical protein